MDEIKILFLSSDPSDAARLRLGQELREIREKLKLSRYREKLLLESRESIRPGDITQAIFDVEPQVVHFSGHGMSTGELCLEDLLGKTKPVTSDSLANLFELVKDQVKCVILNACFSEVQAKAIARHIPFVVGMSQTIGDKAAIAFAVGFYKALGANYSFVNAYKFACVEIQLEGIPQHLIPVFYTNGISNEKQEQVYQENQFEIDNKDSSENLSIEQKVLQVPPSPLTIQPEDDLKSDSGVDYTQLRDLLQSGNWKEADKATSHAMLKAARREPEGYISKNDIERIPCVDILTIDRLWRKYSDNHFSFSIQMKIWMEVGKSYSKFGEHVGWRVKINVTRRRGLLWMAEEVEEVQRHWLSYTGLTFSLNAPEGHLPVVPPVYHLDDYRLEDRQYSEFLGGEGDQYETFYLFSLESLFLRLENCDMRQP